ncbi:PREDICTED: ESF1 homolog isoform X2 [Priapulus caudatus]|uniref:ESF1 homolog isoform X2 n=1 Tax=Priapulus caudatus TaxID=37621 RepID=A0ABM1DPY0_PRICU|nr:PREDICTED: ESF1 homolog isoform X2 [Priapulus caudatus]
MDDITKDARFSHIGRDPRFMRIPQKERKVKIDKRFKAMFENKKFKLKYTVDKRGTPLTNFTTNEDLKRYYELSSSDESDTETAKKKVKAKKKASQKVKAEAKLAKPEKRELRADGDKLSSGHVKPLNQTVPEKDQLETSSSQEDSSSDEEDDDNDDESYKQTVLKSKSPSLVKKKKKNEPEGISDEDDDEDDADDSEDDDDDDDDDNDGINDEKELFDPARGVGVSDSSESSDTTEDDDDDDSVVSSEDDAGWGELGADAPEAMEITARLAVCNMDWDNIKAADIYVMLSSFAPAGGILHSVTIYPSDYGMKRLQEEELKGPAELVTHSSDSENEEAEAGDKSEDSERVREKLRTYQLNRLKYYYAVAEFDSAQTANKVYEESDGMEYESSSTRLDLRFIPEDMVFEQTPLTVCNAAPDISSYKPPLFVTTALNQSKVHLSWDETNKDRLAITSKDYKKEDVLNMDMKAYLASSSEDDEGAYEGIEQPDDEDSVDQKSDGDDDEDDEDAAINKYRALLKGIDDDKDEKEMEMQITWEPGLQESTQQILQKKEKEKLNLTPWEQFLEKKKSKKMERLKNKESSKQQADSDEASSDDDIPAGIDLNNPYFQEELQKAPGKQGKAKKDKKFTKKKTGETVEDKHEQDELELLMMDDKDDGKHHFNLKAIIKEEKGKKKKQKKWKKKSEEKKVEDDFKLNVSDPRFEAVFKSHHYNIDPSDPSFKKTNAMESLIKEKQRRRAAESEPGGTPIAKAPKVAVETTAAKDPQLSALVKSVKSKTRTYYKKTG